ncbi:c-type cytochrome [Antarcticimicrobium luteum]|uniref:Cytochrome c n=1 Tax=Antarcticimicrobium luteum TaxID=2547397 RepID=A0A4R5UZT0_9RHOB|nr:cytochrome c [Antarcticimicrobium luteum]TDK44968.1 cytochrome c [Antarcticimicrobium luteum]
MKKQVFAIAAAAAVIATAAVAQDYSANLKARQGQFRIMALNVGILGGMAQGKIAYDAEAAQRAADTLVAVSHIDPGPLWPEGSDNMSIDGTRAMPSIWDDHDDFLTKWGGFGTAAAGMQQVAATGQEALGPAMGKLGGACKACHDTHRAPE